MIHKGFEASQSSVSKVPIANLFLKLKAVNDKIAITENCSYCDFIVFLVRKRHSVNMYTCRENLKSFLNCFSAQLNILVVYLGQT